MFNNFFYSIYMETNSIQSYLELKKYHFTLFFIHFTQAFAILFLATNFKIPVITTFNQLSNNIGGAFVTKNFIYEIPLVILIWAYLMIAAFFHLLMLNKKINAYYSSKLNQRINPIRWVEYSFSSSIILVVVAILAGYLDFGGLFLIFCLNAIMTYFGYLMETSNNTNSLKINWKPFIVGSIIGALPWVLILFHYFGSLANNLAISNSINLLIPVMFILWTGFPVNMYLHYKEIGPFKEYLNTEKTYIFLSLFTKTLLAWQVLFIYLL